MPKFLESKLKKEYGNKSSVPFKVMNKIGVIQGNKETPKGIAMEKRHLSDAGKAKRKRGMLDKAAEKAMFGTQRSA